MMPHFLFFLHVRLDTAGQAGRRDRRGEGRLHPLPLGRGESPRKLFRRVAERPSQRTRPPAPQYRTNVGGDAKAVKKELVALSEKIIKTATAGGDAQGDLKKFIALAKITDQYNTPLTIWNPTQRRNAGAPTTDTVMDQLGGQGFSFYQSLPGDAPGFKAGYSPAKK